MSLALHIRAKDWSALEQAWTELILGTADLTPALEALSVASKMKEIPRILPLVKEHAEMLAGSERAADAAHLLGKAMLAGGSPGELAKALYANAEAAWGETETWEAFVQIADLRENQPDMRTSWRAFQKLLALGPGRVVHHAKGWGLGGITEIDNANREVRVEFTSGRADRFPFQTAVDIFEMLEDGDLRTLVVLDPEELTRRLKAEPLEILHWVLGRNHGRANHATVKLALGTLGVEGARFTNWWKRARKGAETSEWYEISGPANRAVIRILDRALDPAEGIRRQLKLTHSLAQALMRVKGLHTGGETPEAVRAAAHETLEELARESGSLPERLAVWLFLRDVHGETPPILVEELTRAAAVEASPDPSQVPPLWGIFRAVPGRRDQERCLDLLREVHGETWLDEAARHLPHAAPGMARGLIEALEGANRYPELIAHYGSLLARPTRNPTVLVRLAERLELSVSLTEGDLPAPIQRAQCLLQLAVHLERNVSANPEAVRTRGRLSALLCEGEPPVLRTLLADADFETLRNLASMLESGVERAIDRVFTMIAIELSPDIYRGDERPFWETGGTWTTRAGLQSREEELRLLKDVKIPANAEAIGKAAAYGDLSENSEWDAAIEEQRNLTNRAMQIETEVRGAQLIENAGIPEDTVCPGTEVRYRETESDGERTVEILGPWESDGEGRISYRSPLAAGMLGKHAGDSARIELPTGQIEVEILGVVPIPF